MRFLLLLLSLLLQLNISGFANHNPQENHAKKTLTSENCEINGHSNWFFRFQGQYEDSETGLYYNRFRYYDPSSGNYLSQDPIRLEGNNSTLYTYVSDINSHTDPFGLDDLYALTATKDGWYPVMDWGSKKPIGEVYLKEGDLWKIGTSKDAMTRYTKNYRKNIGQGVDIKVLHTGLSDKTVKALERAKLKGHRAWEGYLPAGNKCCH